MRAAGCTSARTIEARGFRVESGALVLVRPAGGAAAYALWTWHTIEEIHNMEGYTMADVPKGPLMADMARYDPAPPRPRPIASPFGSTIAVAAWGSGRRTSNGGITVRA